ncbi:MAG: hypothetical protein ACLFU8_16985 [Anaerolineales bacterium]
MTRLSLALTLGGPAVLALIDLVSASSSVDVQADAHNPGDLDAGFGTGGVVTTAVGPGNDFAHAVALQRDGRIVAAGYAHNGDGDDYDFAVARYHGWYNVYLPLVLRDK